MVRTNDKGFVRPLRTVLHVSSAIRDSFCTFPNPRRSNTMAEAQTELFTALVDSLENRLDHEDEALKDNIEQAVPHHQLVAREKNERHRVVHRRAHARSALDKWDTERRCLEGRGQSPGPTACCVRLPAGGMQTSSARSREFRSSLNRPSSACGYGRGAWSGHYSQPCGHAHVVAAGSAKMPKHIDFTCLGNADHPTPTLPCAAPVQTSTGIGNIALALKRPSSAHFTSGTRCHALFQQRMGRGWKARQHPLEAAQELGGVVADVSSALPVGKRKTIVEFPLKERSPVGDYCPLSPVTARWRSSSIENVGMWDSDGDSFDKQHRHSRDRSTLSSGESTPGQTTNDKQASKESPLHSAELQTDEQLDRSASPALGLHSRNDRRMHSSPASSAASFPDAND